MTSEDPDRTFRPQALKPAARRPAGPTWDDSHRAGETIAEVVSGPTDPLGSEESELTHHEARKQPGPNEALLGQVGRATIKDTPLPFWVGHG